MKPRVMYIENEGTGLNGPARIGRVTFSKSGKSLYYRGRRFQTLSGSGFNANDFDCESGEHRLGEGAVNTRRAACRAVMVLVGVVPAVRAQQWTPPKPTRGAVKMERFWITFGQPIDSPD